MAQAIESSLATPKTNAVFPLRFNISQPPILGVAEHTRSLTVTVKIYSHIANCKCKKISETLDSVKNHRVNHQIHLIQSQNHLNHQINRQIRRLLGRRHHLHLIRLV